LMELVSSCIFLSQLFSFSFNFHFILKFWNLSSACSSLLGQPSIVFFFLNLFYSYMHTMFWSFLPPSPFHCVLYFWFVLFSDVFHIMDHFLLVFVNFCL
jgi:hypothetical protein